MKALFSEEYYFKFWDRFLEKVPGEDYMNLEADLNNQMRVYDGIKLSEEAIEKIRGIEAKKIADAGFAVVKRELEIAKRIENGESSFGYTTQRQEIEARGEFRRRFEFNCLQLREFKRKYNITE